MIDIPALLMHLAVQRPVFHSEADFQHALAWQIHVAVPDAQVRLEYRLELAETIYLDIWMRMADERIAFELKYSTRKLQCVVAGEEFALKDQSAQDMRRYDFIKDIARLEQVVVSRSHTRGYALLLTNDSSFWNRSLSNATVDAAFRLHEGATLTGSLLWAPHTGTGTMRSRERALHLKGIYPLTWQDYAVTPHVTSYNQFRYLLVSVDASVGDRRADVPWSHTMAQASLIDDAEVPKPENDSRNYRGGRAIRAPQQGGTHADHIMEAVAVLVSRGQSVFTQAELRDQLGLDSDRWARGFSAIFQAMRADHPGGAPPIGARYKGIFRQVKHGQHTLTLYGRERLKDYGRQ